MALTFPDIDPVAVSIGPVAIRWYSLAYIAGIMLGWLYTIYLIGKDKGRHFVSGKYRVGLHRDDMDEFLTWAVIGVILGGRLGYVLFYQPMLYLENPVAIFEVWEGGMSFHGGAIGTIIAMIAFALVKKVYVLRLTDVVCAAVPIGLFFGRIANFINAELYGRVTDHPWGMVFPGGGAEPRHPSQLYEAFGEGLVLFVILFGLAHIKAVRDRPGIISGVFLAGYAVARMSVEQFREPDAHLGFVFSHITMGQILSLPMIVGALILFIWAYVKGPVKTVEPEEANAAA